MMRAAGFLALTAAFGLASWIGWWAVPAVAFLWGFIRPGVSRPVGWAALAALGAWGCWLLVDLVAGQSGLGRLGGRLAATLGFPLVGLVAVTFLLAVLLAGSAAAIGHQIAGWLRRHADRPTV